MSYGAIKRDRASRCIVMPTYYSELFSVGLDLSDLDHFLKWYSYDEVRDDWVLLRERQFTRFDIVMGIGDHIFIMSGLALAKYEEHRV